MTGAVASSVSTREFEQVLAGLDERIAALGGLFNAHLHIDREESLHASRAMPGRTDLSGASALSRRDTHASIPLLPPEPCYELPAIAICDGAVRADGSVQRGAGSFGMPRAALPAVSPCQARPVAGHDSRWRTALGLVQQKSPGHRADALFRVRAILLERRGEHFA